MAARHRGHRQLPAFGLGRSLRRLGQLPARLRAAVAGALSLRRLRPPRGGAFFSHYNLPEVEIYLGILPWSPCSPSGTRAGPRRLAGRERLTWYMVGLFGLLLAFGANTPLEHLFNAIPLYGRQRLQSRNMIDVSVAVCVLFAGWIDRPADPGPPRRASTADGASSPSRSVLGAGRLGARGPGSLVTSLTTASGSPDRGAHGARGDPDRAGLLRWRRRRRLAPPTAPPAWLLLVAAFMARRPRPDGGDQPARHRPRQRTGGRVRRRSRRLSAAHLAPGGRFDLYDPQGYSERPASRHGVARRQLLAGLPSVGGYASIVNGNYNTVTLTHTQGELNVTLARQPATRRSRPAGRPHRARVLPAALARDADDAARSPRCRRPRARTRFSHGHQRRLSPTRLPLYPAPAGPLAGRAVRPPGSSANRSRPDTRQLCCSTTPAPPRRAVRFGTVAADGARSWGRRCAAPGGAPCRSAGRLPAARAVGLAVQVCLGQPAAPSGHDHGGTRTYELDGSLSDGASPRPVALAGSIDGSTLFVRAKPPHPVYAVDAATVGDAAHRRGVRRTTNVRDRSGSTCQRPPPWSCATWPGTPDGTPRSSVNGGPRPSLAVGDRTAWSSRSGSRRAPT